MLLFQVSYERFMEEIKVEKLTNTQRDSLEREDLGVAYAYYLTSMDRPKTYVFVVLKSELTEVQKINLNPLSRVVDRRITETSRLISIAQSLERIEQQLNNPKEKIIEKTEIQVINE